MEELKEFIFQGSSEWLDEAPKQTKNMFKTGDKKGLELLQ